MFQGRHVDFHGTPVSDSACDLNVRSQYASFDAYISALFDRAGTTNIPPIELHPTGAPKFRVDLAEDLMHAMTNRCSFLPAVIACGLVSHAIVAPAAADPINVTGEIFVLSNAGDFPTIPGAVAGLTYTLAGPGLPEARGEVFETSPQHGTTGGLVITRPAVPFPLAAGQQYNLSMHATFTNGQAIESGPPGMTTGYGIAGDFRFDASAAVLRIAEFGDLIGTAPVTFRAILNGFDLKTGAPLFQKTLQGGGSARIRLSPSDPSAFFYQYDVAPVPEPTTPLLIGSGLGLLGVRHRRRCTKR
jgi:hypothetical protein